MLESKQFPANTPVLLVNMQTCIITLEINLLDLPEILGSVLPLEPAMPLLGIYPKDAPPSIKTGATLCS